MRPNEHNEDRRGPPGVVNSGALLALIASLNDANVLWNVCADPQTDWPRKHRHHEPLLTALREIIEAWRAANQSPPQEDQGRCEKGVIPW